MDELKNYQKRELNEYVGRRIKEERQKKKMNQKELASKIGVQNSTLSQYEHGKSEPSQEVLFKIANVLEVNVSDLIPSELRVGDDEFEKAVRMAKDLGLEDMLLLKGLLEKALSLKGAERDRFFDNIKFAVEYYERKNEK